MSIGGTINMSTIDKMTTELSYSNIIQDAFHYWGKEFEAEFKSSTETFDTTIIKVNQKTLWINPPLEKINELKSVFKKSL